MKRLITAAALVTATIASGCATYDTPKYAYDNTGGYYYRTPTGARAAAATNPSYPVVDNEAGATPYREQSMFFKDRGLHQEVPSALVPHVVVPPPAG